MRMDQKGPGVTTRLQIRFMKEAEARRFRPRESDRALNWFLHETARTGPPSTHYGRRRSFRPSAMSYWIAGAVKPTVHVAAGRSCRLIARHKTNGRFPHRPRKPPQILESTWACAGLLSMKSATRNIHLLLEKNPPGFLATDADGPTERVVPGSTSDAILSTVPEKVLSPDAP